MTGSKAETDVEVTDEITEKEQDPRSVTSVSLYIKPMEIYNAEQTKYRVHCRAQFAAELGTVSHSQVYNST